MSFPWEVGTRCAITDIQTQNVRGCSEEGAVSGTFVTQNARGGSGHGSMRGGGGVRARPKAQRARVVTCYGWLPVMRRMRRRRATAADWAVESRVGSTIGPM